MIELINGFFDNVIVQVILFLVSALFFAYSYYIIQIARLAYSEALSNHFGLEK